MYPAHDILFVYLVVVMICLPFILPLLKRDR